jgi:hypothetical protein
LKAGATLIEFSRSLARSFRAVLKKMTTTGGRRDPPTVVVICTDRAGLRIQARNSQMALEYHQSGTYTPDEIAVPAEALAEFESRKDVPVRLGNEHGAVVASWQDKAVPQVRQYDTIAAERLPPIPDLPTRMEHQPEGFLQALQDASGTAGTDAIRFAVNCLQLRGRQGQVVGTDGKQLLVQAGFTFPWPEDVLIPASGVFGCRELQGQQSVSIGKMESFVTLTLGPWTLHVAVEKEARLPKVDAIVPNPTQAATVLHIDQTDAAFLLDTLDSLPRSGEGPAPVTVEGNCQVRVRAKGESQPHPTEIVLARSSVQGQTVSFATERTYLARALRLRFGAINVYAPDRPVLCHDEKRRYVWQPLGKEVVLKASDDAIRISSANGESMAVPVPMKRWDVELVLAAKGAPGIKFVVSYGYSVADGPRRCCCRRRRCVGPEHPTHASGSVSVRIAHPPTGPTDGRCAGGPWTS